MRGKYFTFSSSFLLSCYSRSRNLFIMKKIANIPHNHLYESMNKGGRKYKLGTFYNKYYHWRKSNFNNLKVLHFICIFGYKVLLSAFCLFCSLSFLLSVWAFSPHLFFVLLFPTSLLVLLYSYSSACFV